MSIVIHQYDRSPPCRAVLMIAELLKLNYKTKEVSVQAGDNLTPEFLEKNPLHTVPLLEDGDYILAESHAIIIYLVSKYGADKRGRLYPADLFLKSTIDQRLFFDATVLFSPLLSMIISILRSGATSVTEDQISDVNKAYGVLEKYLEKTKFVASNTITLADVSCVASVSSLDIFVPIDEKYEKLTAWFNKLKDEEWYQKANVPGLKNLKEAIKLAIEENSA